MCKICSKFTLMTPERRQLCPSSDLARLQLTLDKFQTFFCCFHRWYSTNKYRRGKNRNTQTEKNSATCYVDKLNPTHSHNVQNDGVLIIQDSARKFVVQLNIAAEKKCSKKEATINTCSINKVVFAKSLSRIEPEPLF